MARTLPNFLAPLAVIVILLLLLPAGYMLAYFAMLDYEAFAGGSGILFSPPSYRFGGDAVSSFFGPAHHVDFHYLRPEKWVSIFDFFISFGR